MQQRRNCDSSRCLFYIAGRDAIAGDVVGDVATSYQHLAVFYVRLVSQSDFVVHVREPRQRGDPCDESERTKRTGGMAPGPNCTHAIAFADNFCQFVMWIFFDCKFERIVL